MIRFRARHGPRSDGRIKSDQSAPTANSQRQEVEIGELARAVNARDIERLRVKQADCIRPEFMHGIGGGRSKALDYALRRLSVCIARMRHDAHAAVLGDRTGGPTLAGIGGKPHDGARMQRVIGIQQRYEYADVEQGSH